MSETIDRRLILLAPEDNVLVAATDIPAGAAVLIDGVDVTLKDGARLGHKTARRALAVGEVVLKYGAPIGSMTAAAPIGAHVHVHNMKSDYIPTYVIANQADYEGGAA